MKDFREAVDSLGKNRNSVMIKTLYLTASRCNELMTKICPSDVGHTRALGKQVTIEFKKLIVPDIYYAGKEQYVASLNSQRWIGKRRPDDDEISIMLLTIPVLKQKTIWKGVERNPKQKFKIIALPCHPYFEPWIMDILEWLKMPENNGQLCFNLTRQTAYKLIKKLIGYPAHHLRHFRVTHLMNNYKFTPDQIALITGWTVRSSYGYIGKNVSDQIKIYLHSTWQNYIGKLLIPIEEIKKDIITLTIAAV